MSRQSIGKSFLAAFASATFLLAPAASPADGNALGALRGTLSWTVQKTMAPARDLWLARFTDKRAGGHVQTAAYPASGHVKLSKLEEPAQRERPTLDRITTATVADSFFGSVAIPFSSIATRSGWNRVRNSLLDRHEKNCTTVTCRSRLNRLEATVGLESHRSFFEMLQTVNQTVNSTIGYAPDRRIYHRLDYWATAEETVFRGFGDCEDFAILKHALLRQAGIPARSLSLVILKDEARGLYHAVLAVSTNKGHFILDNVRNQVYRDTTVSNYRPLYSLSANRSWIHGYRAKKGREIAQSPLSFGAIAPGESVYSGEDDIASSSDALVDLRPTSAF